jgi:hypothetical protein
MLDKLRYKSPMHFKVLKPISDFPNETPKFEATSRNLSGDLGEDDDDEEGDCEEEDEDEEVVTVSQTFYGNPKHVITLGQSKCDNNSRMITITSCFYLVSFSK